MKAHYLNHGPVMIRGWIKHGKDQEALTGSRPQRLDPEGPDALGHLAPAARSGETVRPAATRAPLGKLGHPRRVASRRNGHPVEASSRALTRADARARSNGMSLALCLGLSLLGTGCVSLPATQSDDVASMPNPMLNAAYSEDADVAFVVKPQMAAARKLKKDDFASESASRRTRDMARWVVASRDNLDMPFAIVDKVNAKVYVFEGDGAFYGAAPVLLGLAKGDHAVPGVGDKPLSRIPPSDRTTPAGRFLSKLGRNTKGKEILWLDYEGALSMHAVVKGTAKDRRAERLASPTPLDNRISFGCINVPTDFFKDAILEKFSGAGGVVYILPETKQLAKS